MSFMLENLPSGLRLPARKFKVDELLELAHAHHRNDADGGLSRVVERCLETIEDPGAYKTFRSGHRVDINRMLTGDMMVGARDIRVESIGPEYPGFRPKCSTCDRQQPEMTVDLTEFDVRPLPEESKKILLEGDGIFQTKIPSTGQTVKYKLSTVDQSSRVIKLKQSWQKRLLKNNDPFAKLIMGALPLDFLLAQVQTVEGEDIERDPIKKCEWARNLDLGDFYALEQAMRDADCGLDATVEFECDLNGCRAHNEAAVPLAGEFFRPRPRPKKTQTAEERGDQD
jgi:hypothetical protein